MKPLILVTNDDGITAPGIRALVTIAQDYGTPVVVAPDKPQSGQGHAITISEPLRLKKVEVFEGIESYECSGTPVDCVKLARNVLLKDREIALCVSGINHGSNASINIIYSGTMSAAMEASLEHIPAIGFSHLDYGIDADFAAAEPFIRQLIEKSLSHDFKHAKLLNVNIPNLPREKLRGIRICRQAVGSWTEEFQERSDPYGRTYYWMTGQFVNEDSGEDTDIWALENGYISVVPSQHDLTAYSAIEELKDFES